VKHIVDVLLNVRIVAGEVVGTGTFLFLLAYGLYKAWETFIRKLLK
jgi:hypothetical protein